MNIVVITGRLVRDPELRHTNSGTPVVEFTVAVDRRKKSGQETTADFFRCKAWEKTAEFVGNFLTKGRSVTIHGRLETRKFTAKDGTEREVVEIVAETVESEKPRDETPRQTNTPYKEDPEDEYDPFADE